MLTIHKMCTEWHANVQVKWNYFFRTTTQRRIGLFVPVFFTLAIAQNTPFQISAFRKVPSRILP